MQTSNNLVIDLASGTDNESTAKRPAAATCHLMPCSIEYGKLDVRAREYFWPTVRELKIGGDDEQGRSLKHDKSVSGDNTEDPILLASFRGRPLQGRRIQVPTGYLGHVVGKDSSSSSSYAGNSQDTKIKKHFREFTYWNWDELPDKNDTVVKALNWLQVAKAIHDPVE